MKRNIVGKRLLSERILNKVVYPPRVEPEIIPHVTQRNLEKFIRGETFQSQVASDSDTGGDPSIYLLLPGEDIVEEHRPHPHETHEEDEDEGVDACEDVLKKLSGSLLAALKSVDDDADTDAIKTPKQVFVVVYERIYELTDGTLERCVDTEFAEEVCSTFIATMNLEQYIHVMREFIMEYKNEGPNIYCADFMGGFNLPFYPETFSSDETLGFMFGFLLDKASKGLLHGLCSKTEYPNCICRETKVKTLLKYGISREQVHATNNERLLSYIVIQYANMYWESVLRALHVPCS